MSFHWKCFNQLSKDSVFPSKCKGQSLLEEIACILLRCIKDFEKRNKKLHLFSSLFCNSKKKFSAMSF